ncbi:MAG TPA: hypothetical protein VE548_02055 [Nitrososphaeraceae archaeon]|jgi:hypothetical protein|nr:hypothetical protein [Nitrososphaeraceae archaeon]
MSGIENSERIKYSISIEMEVPSYQATQYLPDSLVVKFDKKKVETNEAIQQHVEQPIRIDNKIPDEKIGLDRKLRLFIDIFNALSGDDKNDVKKEILIEELVDTSKFTEDEAMVYVKKAQQYGFIYERKIGMYAIA